ncbi:MAG: hypothetical protein PGN07_04680 [Aeromicrobium erythreum]
MTASLKKQRRQHLSTLHYGSCDETDCGWTSTPTADISDAKVDIFRHNVEQHPDKVVGGRDR